MSERISVTDDGTLVVYTILARRVPFVPLADRQDPFNLPHTRWFKGGVKPKNDWMKQRSYDAERQLCLSEQTRWDDFKPVAYYLRDVIESSWFSRRWPCFNMLKMVYHRGTSTAWASPRLEGSTGVINGRMSLSRWAIGAKEPRPGAVKLGGEAVVLHELAHALCPVQHEHSPLWARTYLELVGYKMGAEAYRTLRDGFDNCGVRYSPYRLLSPERRVQLADQMRAVRAARGTPCSTTKSQGSPTC